MKRALLLSLCLLGCASPPLLPYRTDGPPLMLVPAVRDASTDLRGRFTEIFCSVLEARRQELPDYRSCDAALVQLSGSPPPTGRPVELGPAMQPLEVVLVPGLAWNCFSSWIGAEDSLASHLRRLGYTMRTIEVEGLASSEVNARRIRDALVQAPSAEATPRIVLVGYSKGAADVLEAVVRFPEIRARLAAVVSLAGAIGGSPLAATTTGSQVDLLRFFPGSRCRPMAERALQDLLPSTRKRWLATHALPEKIPFYSIVALPAPERISRLGRRAYAELARVDARNDGQLLFYDQVIPGSRLVAYLDADHWAVAVPIARTHPFVGSTLLDQNEFPREAMFEALMRLIEEDLYGAASPGDLDPTR